jgi:solute carrier family 45 protein 1/2/4
LSAKVPGGGGYRRLSNDDRDGSPDLEESISSSVLTLEHGAVDDGVASTGELSGIYFGILNIYSTIPQFLASVLSMFIFAILEPGKSPELAHDANPEEHHGVDGPNAISVCLFIGAICALGAAYATRRLKYID